MSMREKHTKQLIERLHCPDLVGINKKDLFFIAMEGSLMKDSVRIGEPDLVYFSKSGIYVVEHKVNMEVEAYQSALAQLMRTYHRFKDAGVEEEIMHLIMSHSKGYEVVR